MARSSSVSRLRKSIVLLAAVSVGVSAISAGPARADVSPKDVDAAVDKAVAHLLSLQNKDGNWESGGRPKPMPGFGESMKWGGETAIATYALMAAGMGANDPKIKKAIEWLEGEDLHGTYAVGLRSQVWNLIPELARTKAVYANRDRDKDFVLYSRIQKGPNMGFYSYTYGTEMALSAGGAKMDIDKKGPPQGSGYDRSNSQYGVLGAWALEQAGAEIPTQFWLDEDAAWKKAQLPDGGWNYNGGGESTATMTAAGLATLFITQDYVMRSNSHQFDTCKGGVTNPNIEKGLAWMDRHVGQAIRGTGGWSYYGLYGIERVGVASGQKYFSTIDWFQTGAEVLIKGQQPNGGWGEIHDTCFGLLFLCRGRAPVMMNKLIYETASHKLPDPWNERPRDTANLAKWMGKHSLEGFLNWQIVNLKVSVDELHDAPILYISGNEDLALSNQDIDKLRQFVEQGGMILGNADCGSKIFASSFEKLGSKLFPKYEFRRLLASHPIFDEQYHASKWKAHPEVEAMSNGVRELLVLVPEADLGKAWQNESTKTKEENYQLGGNIFLYATGKENLTHKGETYIVHADGEAGRDIKLARIAAGDNPDPEPGAWRRMGAILHNERHVEIKPEMVKLGDGALAGYKIAHLTGTTKIKLSAAAEKDLKDFVDKGGTLIVDSAGGSSEFADTIETELTKIWGSAATIALSTPLPPDHAIYNDAKNKIEKINYRSFARHTFTGKVHDPRVRGIMVGSRVGVFYSREDLTAGLVGEPVDGIIGYSPENASQIMGNIVMFADDASKGGAPVAGAGDAAPADASTAPAAKKEVKSEDK